MVTVAQAQRLFASNTGYLEAEMDQRFRPLRDAGLLPIGGRGPHAPPVDAQHLVFMLLALVPRRASDALETVARAGRLVFVPHPSFKDPFEWNGAGELTLAGALYLVMVKPQIAWRSIRVSSDGGIAFATISVGGRDVDFLFSENPEKVLSIVDGSAEAYGNQGQAAMRHMFHLPRGYIETFAQNHLRHSAKESTPTSTDWNQICKAIEEATSLEAVGVV